MTGQTSASDGRENDRRTLVECVGYALTGQFLSSEVWDGVDDVPGLASRLVGSGWTVNRLRQIRAEVRQAGGRWPFALPAGVPVPTGAAQFHAWVGQILQALELDSHDAGVRDASQPMDAETRRLLADRPPHYGSVG